MSFFASVLLLSLLCAFCPWVLLRLFAIPHLLFSYPFSLSNLQYLLTHAQSSFHTVFFIPQPIDSPFTLPLSLPLSTYQYTHNIYPPILSLYEGFLSLGIAPLLIKEEKMEFFFPACGGLKVLAFAAGLVVGTAGMRGTGAGGALATAAAGCF